MACASESECILMSTDEYNQVKLSIAGAFAALWKFPPLQNAKPLFSTM